MPYNTRRKSLSLPALGIQLPNASRTGAGGHRPSLSKSSTTTEPEQQHDEQQPTKRVKRSHSSSGSPTPFTPIETPSTAPAAVTKTVTFADRPLSSGRNAYEHTPPPSPGRESQDAKIDLDSVNDDIVLGVIEQLQKTGNRPHLIKELATVLSTTNDSVAGSANPTALLSSRLSAYMKRACWSAISPCPVAKELIPVHPRKVFYYLTTSPRQELPSFTTEIDSPLGGKGKAGKRIVSPSLSNASQDDDASAAEDRRRAALSPSPEIDLSFDMEHHGSAANLDFPTPGSSLSGSSGRDGGDSVRERRRSEGPRLEGDEREFTATAHGMRLRGLSGADLTIDPNASAETYSYSASLEHPREKDLKTGAHHEDDHHSEAAAQLFWPSSHHDHHPQQTEVPHGATAQSASQGEAHGAEDAMVLSSPTFETRPPHHSRVNSVMSVDDGNANGSDKSASALLTDLSAAKTAHGGSIDAIMEEDEDAMMMSSKWGGEISRPEDVNLEDLDVLFGGF